VWVKTSILSKPYAFGKENKTGRDSNSKNCNKKNFNFYLPNFSMYKIKKIDNENPFGDLNN
jgi:hypothetical protein